MNCAVCANTTTLLSNSLCGHRSLSSLFHVGPLPACATESDADDVSVGISYSSRQVSSNVRVGGEPSDVIWVQYDQVQTATSSTDRAAPPPKGPFSVLGALAQPCMRTTHTGVSGEQGKEIEALTLPSLRRRSTQASVQRYPHALCP
eukprot:48476-Eustigmatos_ZCMA.PRE.1